MRTVYILIALIIIVTGSLTSFIVSQRVLEEATLSWQDSAIQEAIRVSDTGQFWVADYISAMKAMGNVYLNSSSVNEDEFFDSFDYVLNPEAGTPLNNMAFAPLPASGQETIFTISTEFDGPLAPEAAVTDIPGIEVAINTAQYFAGDVAFGPPFIDENGQKISVAVLYIETGAIQGYLISLFDLTGFAQTLENVQVPDGMSFDLAGSWRNSGNSETEEQVFQSARSRPGKTYNFPVRVMIGKNMWLFDWHASAQYSGDIEQRLSTYIFYGGSAISVLTAFLVGFLLMQNQAVRRTVDMRTRELRQATDQMARLLNASGQGFLSFDKNFVVGPVYSRACEVFFGTAPVGLPIEDLLFPGETRDSEACNVFRRGLTGIFATDDPLKTEMLTNLLPAEFEMGGRVLGAEYRRAAGRDTMMIILTDITEERELQQGLEANRQRLERVVHVVSDRDGFIALHHEFTAFLEALRAGEYDSGRTGDASLLALLYRQIHTYKGVFSQYAFTDLPAALHDIENSLRHAKSPEDWTRVEQAINRADLTRHLEGDLDVLFESLGKDFLRDGAGIWLTEDQYDKIDQQITQLLDDNPAMKSDQRLTSMIKNWRYLRCVPVNSLITPLINPLPDMAERLGKSIATPVVTGGDIRINPGQLRPFFKSLVHVFRNALTHGIEDPDSRFELGKDEDGQILCDIQEQGTNLVITISDDGRGLDIAALKEKVLRDQLIDAETLDSYTDTQLQELVFLDRLSTQDEADHMAGRGVGLAAVKAELALLDGTVDIRTTPNKGTTFTFTLPAGTLSGITLH